MQIFEITYLKTDMENKKRVKKVAKLNVSGWIE